MLGGVLILQVLYFFAAGCGYLNRKKAELIILHGEYLGTVIAIFSVVTATGVKFGDYSPQMVRWESAGLISFLLLTIAWETKWFLAMGAFKD